MSTLNELERVVDKQITRANRLRQSILSRAFSGRLTSAGTALHVEAMA